jgi:hypothetical protein
MHSFVFESAAAAVLDQCYHCDWLRSSSYERQALYGRDERRTEENAFQTDREEKEEGKRNDGDCVGFVDEVYRGQKRAHQQNCSCRIDRRVPTKVLMLLVITAREIGTMFAAPSHRARRNRGTRRLGERSKWMDGRTGFGKEHVSLLHVILFKMYGEI